MTSSSAVTGSLLKADLFKEDHNLSGDVSPSIMIRDLCREQHYSSVSYEEGTKVLKSFGFECLRISGDSRRSSEVWILHELCAARGALKDYIKALRIDCSILITKEQIHDVLRFIFEHSPYGMARVSVCHVNMGITA